MQLTVYGCLVVYSFGVLCVHVPTQSTHSHVLCLLDFPGSGLLTGCQGLLGKRPHVMHIADSPTEQFLFLIYFLLWPALEANHCWMLSASWWRASTPWAHRCKLGHTDYNDRKHVLKS